MATRPYHKRNIPYWDSRSKRAAEGGAVSVAIPASMANGPVLGIQAPHMEAEAAFDDQPHYSARAACGGGSIATQYRDGYAPNALASDNFPNIRSGIVPYAMMDGGYYGVSEVIGLCYKAYHNFAILRNAIKLIRDFSVGPIHVKTSNQRVKTFIETWFEAIGLNQFMAQFFLEYSRSGNVFIYKFSGQISEDGMNMLRQAYGAAGDGPMSATVPIRYIILNPMQVYLQMGPTEPYGYVRMLSTYEIARLRNPQTEEDRQMLESFPKEVKRIIKQTGSNPYLYVPLDPKRLYPVFYDKMDYEPLAVPMAFPVLNDIEYKLELRRMDMALAATIERVILLVTTGRPADQWNQVPPKSNLQNLQEIFRNQTIGRVLVADYTTKAEWVVPDLKELLGPGKYQQVDKDIKEGLQYMFFGDEKFANASVKIKIFIESLREGRRAFLENFLIPEVKKVCAAMGFRNVPDLEFEEIQMQDEALMARLYVQMAQLGLLTADELNEALVTGMLPSKDESLKNQEAYKEARKQKLYAPLAPEKAEGAGSSVGKGRPGGTGGTPATRRVATPIGQQKVRGGLDAAFARADAREGEGDVERPSRFRFGMTKVAENLVCMNGLKAAVEEAFARKWKLKVADLGPEERGVAASMAQAIVFNEDGGPDGKRWLKAIPAYLKAPKDLPEAVAADLLEIRASFDTPQEPVDSWLAGVLLRSKVEMPG
jgi:hypothetical protein